MSLMNLDCPLTVGQKRPIELVDSNTIDNKEIELINLKKRCIDLEQRVEILEKTCLCKFISLNSIRIFYFFYVVIPQHMTSIQNFFHDIIQSSNNNNDIIMLNNNDSVTINNDNIVTVNDDIISVNNDDIVTVNNNDDKTSNAITVLNIDDVTLASLKRENATSTARAILKYFYPNPEMNFKLKNMDKALVAAIIGKSGFFHFHNLFVFFT
jgi:hypothetical protein